MEKNCIEINIGNGLKLVAEQNLDNTFNREIYIGIVDGDGSWVQSLAIVRQDYSFDAETLEPIWKDNMMRMVVWSDPNREEWTSDFRIGLSDYGIERMKENEYEVDVDSL